MTPLSGNSFLQNYMDLNKTLVKTMVIKSLTSCEALNEFIKLKYGEGAVDNYDPSSWKYYKNIAGEYHVLDTPMTVTSLDTLEEIAFDKDTLRQHTVTRKAYRYGTRYYYSLLNRYPDQEQLIMGILTPVDKTLAIEAEDGTILSYPSDLVEPQEVSLIPELQQFIKNQLVRWHVKAFAVSDSLYNAAQHALLYLSILPKLLNLRLKRCKTPEAHSFHIRQYLASNRGLDRYMPYMTLKQKLWLYRNINYIERNAGSVEQFRYLVDKLLTDRQIPLIEYTVRHLNEFDGNYYPLINARKKPVNLQTNVSEIEYIDIQQLYQKEEKLAYSNPKFYLDNSDKVTDVFRTTNTSVLQTKDLESNMVDYNDAVPDPLERVLMRQWFHAANNNLYNVLVSFKDPKTSETRTLYALDAFIYYIYILIKREELGTNDIPIYLNIKYRRPVLPTLNEIMSVVPDKYSYLSKYAQVILDNQPNLDPSYSTEMFYNQSFKIYEESKRHWHMVSNIHGLNDRGYLQGIVNQLYEVKYTTINTPHETFSSWLGFNNLPEYDYTYEQSNELLVSIFSNATGLIIDDSRLLKNIQKAMLDMMTELSSYSVQFIREINADRITPITWPLTRVGDVTSSVQQESYIEHPVRVTDVSTATETEFRVQSDISEVVCTQTLTGDKEVSITSSNTVTSLLNERYIVDVYYSSNKISADYEDKDPNISNNESAIWMEYFHSLSDEQKLELKSIYD